MKSSPIIPKKRLACGCLTGPYASDKCERHRREGEEAAAEFTKHLTRSGDAMAATLPDNWRSLCFHGWKSSREHWMRWTDSSGLYWWLHPETGQWVGEPQQIDMPTWPSLGDAMAALAQAPEPPV